jgi:hypothetical protein
LHLLITQYGYFASLASLLLLLLLLLLFRLRTLLKIQGFWDVTLCCWVNSFDISKYHSAFIFNVTFMKKALRSSETSITVSSWHAITSYHQQRCVISQSHFSTRHLHRICR